jgi:hypothetical protein
MARTACKTSEFEYAIGRMLYNQGFRCASRPARVWLVRETKCSKRMQAHGSCRISSGGKFAVGELQEEDQRSSARSGRSAEGVMGALVSPSPTGTQTPRCNSSSPSARFDCARSGRYGSDGGSWSGHEHESWRVSQPRHTGLRSSHFFRRRRQHRQPVFVRLWWRR